MVDGGVPADSLSALKGGEPRESHDGLLIAALFRGGDAWAGCSMMRLSHIQDFPITDVEEVDDPFSASPPPPSRTEVMTASVGPRRRSVPLLPDTARMGDGPAAPTAAIPVSKPRRWREGSSPEGQWAWPPLSAAAAPESPRVLTIIPLDDVGGDEEYVVVRWWCCSGCWWPPLVGVTVADGRICQLLLDVPPWTFGSPISRARSMSS